MNTNLAVAPGSAASSIPSGAVRKWAARVMAALAMLFLGFDTTLKVFLIGPAVEGSAKLGFSTESVMLWLPLFLRDKRVRALIMSN